MESSTGKLEHELNESNECDVSQENAKRDDDATGQRNVDRKMKAEDERERILKDTNPSKLEDGMDSNVTMKSKTIDAEEPDEEDEKSKASVDEEERKEETRTSEKKEEETSSETTSTSTSDDESETSSEDKTEPIKEKAQTEAKMEGSTKNEAKNDDTDDSDIEDDLISAINYNTITSLTALKDMLQSTGKNSNNVDSFFHHYFLSHVNRLPSRNQTHSPYPWGRRLSECREEDEEGETEEGER